jgi:hypothetical protein
VFQIETKKHHELSISNQAIAVLRLLNVRTVLMAYLNKVLAGNEISADQRIGIDAGIVILGNERTFTVRAEEFMTTSVEPRVSI